MSAHDLFPETLPKPLPSEAGKRWWLIHNDSERELRSLQPSCIDSLVTDPPAGIDFMGREWDSNKGGRDHWIRWFSGIASQCLRVLKPGAFGFVWALPRTSHWTATALENGGFEIRDISHHLFGTGFPKGTNQATIPTAWKGWNTALKPAAEHWILVRKPPVGTLAENLEAHGVGALNIDGARLGGDTRAERNRADASGGSELGRWPANVTLSPEAAEELDAQSGTLRSGSMKAGTKAGTKARTYSVDVGRPLLNDIVGSEGGASRFFYVAKPTRSERDAGCERLPPKQQDDTREADAAGANNPRNRGGGSHLNHHPTVKPVVLMRWLARLITPPGGLVLDPFTGSGTTGVAALAEGFRFLGLEREAEYFAIARARLEHATEDAK